MKSIKVSIIIPSYNTKELIAKCIESIFKYTKNVSYEIIVVENGSTDGSKAKLLTIKEDNYKLSVIVNDNNLGFAKACNQGIKKAKGKYILLLNSDTQLRSNAIAKMIDFASSDKQIGVVGAKLVNPDGTAQSSVYRLPTLTTTIKEYWFGVKGLSKKYTPLSNKPEEVESVVGAAFLITPKCIKKVGLLDDRYFMYFEDLDYCRRVVRNGLKVYYLPSAEVVHIHGASGKSLIRDDKQWRRLIPSSKLYFGPFKHYLISFVIRIGNIIKK